MPQNPGRDPDYYSPGPRLPRPLAEREHIEGVLNSALDKMDLARRDMMPKAFTAEECVLLYRTEVCGIRHRR